MKKMLLLLSLAGAMILVTGTDSYSQSFIKKIKKKAEEKLVKKAFGEEEEKKTSPGEEAARPSMKNTRGGGLVTTPPDVESNITQAEKAIEEKEYSQTRHAIRQAILGIEMQIGQNILEGLPDKVGTIPANMEMDRVASSGIGFVGLTIERVYRSDDQELKVTVANDAALLSAVNMYMTSGYYEQSSDEQQYKEVDYKGYRGILEYDDAEGYTLSVPFGQSSVIVFNGVNFADEGAIMTAAGNIDIENIKKELGEK